MTAGSPALDIFEPLADEQVELVHQLKAVVKDTVEAHPELLLFCNDWCYVRYLRARQWSLPRATKMLQATLEWRVQYRPHAITWEAVEAEAASGKNFVSPYPDRRGAPVVLMRPRNENTKDEAAQLRFLVYCLEHASRLADARRVGKMTWLIDFVGYSMRNAPSVRASLDVLHVLQNHYPERLGCAVCFCAPSLFSLTWRAVSPFIDPVTKRKVDFVGRPSAASPSPLSSSVSASASGGSLASSDAFDVDVLVDGGEANAAAAFGSIEAHFDMENLEKCMGGRHDGALFELESYRARMRAEDAQVAAAVASLSAVSAPVPA